MLAMSFSSQRGRKRTQMWSQIGLGVSYLMSGSNQIVSSPWQVRQQIVILQAQLLHFNNERPDAR